MLVECIEANASLEKIQTAKTTAIAHSYKKTNLVNPFDPTPFNPDELAEKARTENKTPYDILGEWIDNQKFSAKLEQRFFEFSKENMESALGHICLSLIKDQAFTPEGPSDQERIQGIKAAISVKPDPNQDEDVKLYNETLQKASAQDIATCQFGSKLALLWMTEAEIKEAHAGQAWPQFNQKEPVKMQVAREPYQPVTIRTFEEIYAHKTGRKIETNLGHKDPKKSAEAFHLTGKNQKKAALFFLAKNRPEVLLLLSTSTPYIKHPTIQKSIQKAAENCTPELAEIIRKANPNLLNAIQRKSTRPKEKGFQQKTIESIQNMINRWKTPIIKDRTNMTSDIPF